MQEVRTVPLGGDLQSWVPGFPIRAIEISNASASWLNVNGWWVPPFTFGWMHSFTPALIRVNINSEVGPDGQAVIAQGDPAIAIAYDVPQRNSNGIHYLSNP